MKMVALTELQYASVTYHPGQHFFVPDVDANHANLLQLIGKARIIPDPPLDLTPVQAVFPDPAPAPAPEPAAEVAPAPQPGPATAEEPPRPPRRRYMRRDIVPEE